MSDWHLQTPVAFIIFNRPDTTERVFAEIAKAKPLKLLVVADGPRVSRPGEAEKCAATRAIIEKVDWDCEVLTNFSEVNLGCKRRVSSGIDWVFEQVEEAIILEDDCLPDPTFFRFCQKMLERYRYEQRIGMISGRNFQTGHCRSSDSYYFSKYVHIWGWASWRDRWIGSYDVTMAKWPRLRNEGWLTDIGNNAREASYWNKVFECVYCDRINTWDYQWLFANWLEGRTNIVPSVNLIANIGFGEDATHTAGGRDLVPVEAMSFPLKHPLEVLENRDLDKELFDHLLYIPLYKRVLNRIRRAVRL